MSHLTIRTVYPCCGKAGRFTAHSVPMEAYVRVCRSCETTWDVTRKQLRSKPHRMDSLMWFDTKSREYRQTYG